MRWLLLAALLIGCGAAPRSLVDGEWAFEFRGVTCGNGAAASGTLVIYEGAGGSISGQYDVCAATFAASDLSGHIIGQRFELAMFGGAVGVVDGTATPDVLNGRVVGLGDGVVFHATRAGARQGKRNGDGP